MSNTLYEQLPSEVLRTGQRCEFKSGDVLFVERATPLLSFFVEHGCVRLVVQPVEGKELVLYRARDGELIAEDHLVRNSNDFTAIADKKTVVVSVNRQVLLAHVTSNYRALMVYLSLLNNRNEQLRTNFQRLALPKATDKVLHLLRSLTPDNKATDLTGRLKTLASDLNMTHETMYRALRTLEERQVISRDKGWVRVLR